MLKATAERLSDLRCPDCGTHQPLWTLGARNKVILRRAHDVEPCPQCQVPLHLPRRSGPELVAALAYVTGGAGLVALAFALVGPLSPGWTLTLLMGLCLILYAGAILIIGLVSRHTRTVAKGDPA